MNRLDNLRQPPGFFLNSIQRSRQGPTIKAQTVFVFLVPLLLALFCGCRNRDAELLEGELRSREIQYREALDELKKLGHFNQALQWENLALRQGKAISPEMTNQVFTLKRISLGRGTGGHDADRRPGDEALQVVLEPRDGDDHVVKVPGQVHITALEIQPQGGKTLLSCWELGPEELRKAWKSGFFSNGFILTLPWKSWPSQEQVRVVAKLTLSDGRVFEADKDVKVRPLPGAKPPTVIPSQGDPAFPGLPGPDLPPPRIQEEITAQRYHPTTADSNLGHLTPTGQWQPTPGLHTVQLGQPIPLLSPAAPGD